MGGFDLEILFRSGWGLISCWLCRPNGGALGLGFSHRRWRKCVDFAFDFDPEFHPPKGEQQFRKTRSD